MSSFPRLTDFNRCPISWKTFAIILTENFVNHLRGLIGFHFSSAMNAFRVRIRTAVETEQNFNEARVNLNAKMFTNQFYSTLSCIVKVAL